MEEGVKSLLTLIGETFPEKKQDIRSYSALTLAYIGDCIYEIIIRTVVVGKGNRPVNNLNNMVIRFVCARSQAKIVEALVEKELLTEEELAVFKRGKNSKPHTTAKNASTAEYLTATGFESVIGYLYLQDKMERALELVKQGIEAANMKL